MTDTKYEPIGKYLSVLYRAMNILLDEKLSVHGISRGEFPFLVALYHKEGVSQQELCEFYDLDKALAARALTKLGEKKLVKRVKDSEDKRQYKIYLTEAGRDLKSTIIEVLKDVEEKACQGLGSDEIAQFKITVKKMSTNLGKSI